MKKLIAIILTLCFLLSSVCVAEYELSTAKKRPANEINPWSEGDPLYKKYFIEIEENTEQFTDELSLVYSLDRTVGNVLTRNFGDVKQNNFSEIMHFNSELQHLTVYFYLTYRVNSSREETRKVIEEYTDVLIEVLSLTYPQIQIDAISFNWMIPSISPDSLYSATYWCESVDGIIQRGEGAGALYNNM